MPEGGIGFAFLLTLLAGLSTGIGGAIAFFAKRTNTRFLSAALGFSAGVMIYVSFVEIFPQARETLVESLGEGFGPWVAVLAFFSGIFLIAVIDKLVPSFENPHEVHTVEKVRSTGTAAGDDGNYKLLKMGMLMAMAVAVHNFPEGLAAFIASLKSQALGVYIGIAVAIHNIPEGIAVSIPVYYATGDRRKAFWYSFLSGLAEPFGALSGYLILSKFLTEVAFGAVFAAVGGIMVFISLDQLLPTAREYGEHHLSVYGLVLGMMVMAASLLLAS
ncbi:zinc transporter ZupT [Thermosediminibacter oceani]|uniref:Zinc transporter ZupT n=1 Tax=Thermosediminibacter oceani (strain ATCC BAA-1034 / DSM 16646 / JW/IW-1228P) TaxID=555079 RepID=D9RZU3_THEOJ|nr:zinc transporter ZupT [Thermosediminibacter oceani]ADL08720.1 zinc/iron permease [Thermosediminibacter oceani DSM 16646]